MKFTIDIDPGSISVNGRLIPQYIGTRPTGRLVLSPDYRLGLDLMSLQVRQACIEHGWKTSTRQCRVSIFTRWPGPSGDAGSTEKAVCDALQLGLAVANDKLCRPLVIDCTWNCHKSRGIEVEIEELSDA